MTKRLNATKRRHTRLRRPILNYSFQTKPLIDLPNRATLNNLMLAIFIHHPNFLLGGQWVLTGLWSHKLWMKKSTELWRNLNWCWLHFECLDLSMKHVIKMNNVGVLIETTFIRVFFKIFRIFTLNLVEFCDNWKVPVTILS